MTDTTTPMSDTPRTDSFLADFDEQHLMTDLTNWPRDPANGRYLCSPEHPMPLGAKGQWSHTNVDSSGSCFEGCCDRYICKDCGHRWTVEVAQ